MSFIIRTEEYLDGRTPRCHEKANWYHGHVYEETPYYEDTIYLPKFRMKVGFQKATELTMITSESIANRTVNTPLVNEVGEDILAK